MMKTMDTISGLLERVRENITRYEPDAAADRLRAGALLIDLRPLEFRLRNGDIPGAIAVSRHVLEWRLDVTSSWRLKELEYGDYDQEVILLCNEGYTSSLAAHQVMSAVGLRAVGDVVGGFADWKAAGHPVVERSTVE